MRNRIAAAAALLLLGTAHEGAAQVQRFALQWEGPSARASGFITLDLSQVNNPGATDNQETPFITDFEFTVTGAFAGNGTFGLSDYDGLDTPPPLGRIVLSTEDITLDFTRELVGQTAGLGTWGALEDGAGDFALFRDLASMAPAINQPFVLVTYANTDLMALTSFRPALCGDAPVDAGSCLAAESTSLVIKDTDSADSLKWNWRGAAFDQSMLGDPVASDTYYSLCIYDETASTPALAVELGIKRGAGWTDRNPRGLEYSHTGASYGVTRAKIRPGDDGKTSVKVQAGTEALQLPGPTGAEYFDQDGDVTVQLLSSDGTCWTSSYSAAETSRNQAGVFKAQVK